MAAAVNSAPPGAVLRLPSGTCHVHLEISNRNAFVLAGAVRGATVLRPAVATEPIIESAADVRFTLRGLTFTGATRAPAVQLQGAGEAVTVTGNRFFGNRFPGGPGAAISLHTYSSTTHRPTVISANAFVNNAADEGGAVAAVDSPQRLTITENTFSRNSTGSASNGGALYIASNRPTTALVDVTGNVFGRGRVPGNTARDRGGAAVFLLGWHQPLRLHDNCFQGNRLAGDHTAGPGSPRQGGAVFIGPEVTGTTFKVSQSGNHFVENRVEVTQSTPSPLRPAGGGAEWIAGVSVSSSHDVFSANRVAVNDGQPPQGGAVGITGTPATSVLPARPGVLVATDDLVQRNSTVARGQGGAISTGQDSRLTLNDSTVVGNRVDGAGVGVWGASGDRLTLRNSILYGRQAQLFGFAAGDRSISFSDVCPLAAGRGDVCAAPHLSPSGSETGRSPTIDAGSNALVPRGLHTDLLGHRRIRAARLPCRGKRRPVVDIGAFEFTGRLRQSCPLSGLSG